MQKIVDYGATFGALLTDFKAFDCIKDDLFLAKLESHGFQTDALNIFSVTICLIENKE